MQDAIKMMEIQLRWGISRTTSVDRSYAFCNSVLCLCDFLAQVNVVQLWSLQHPAPPWLLAKVLRSQLVAIEPSLKAPNIILRGHLRRLSKSHFLWEYLKKGVSDSGNKGLIPDSLKPLATLGLASQYSTTKCCRSVQHLQNM